MTIEVFNAEKATQSCRKTYNLMLRPGDELANNFVPIDRILLFDVKLKNGVDQSIDITLWQACYLG